MSVVVALHSEACSFDSADDQFFPILEFILTVGLILIVFNGRLVLHLVCTIQG